MDEQIDISGHAGSGRFAFGPFVLTTRPLALSRDGIDVPLRYQALRLLLLFVECRGRLVGHAQIRRHVWGDRYVDHTRGTHLLVGEIRQALGDPAREPRYIETLPRQGYRFLAPVRRGKPFAARRRYGALAAAAAIAGLALCVVLLRSPGDLAASPAEAPYAKAMHLADRQRPEDWPQADAYLAEALSLDPASADVRAGLAKVARLRGDLDAAEMRAREALSLDPRHAGGHLELGVVLAMRDWNWADAARQIDRAISADPANADAYAARAAILTVLGRHRDALEASDRAYAVDPVSALVRVDHGWFHYYAGEYDSAWRACGEAAKLAADEGPAVLCQYKAASLAGDGSRALQAAARLVSLWRASEPASSAARFGSPSSIDEFKRMRRTRIERLRAANQAPPEAFATAYAEVGDLPAALDLLEEAFHSRSAGLPFALRDPVFGPVRAEPRFRLLLSQTVAAAAEGSPSS